jgi:proline iminopeptidase
MKMHHIAARLPAALRTASSSDSAMAQVQRSADPTETSIPVGSGSLYARVIGQGQPVIVLHGGPDFDHSYLLPELDQLAEAFRLIYYDQRGRGKSAEGVCPDGVTLASDLEDLDRVREHFRLDAPALLGHSWGAVLALEYALRHPSRVSHLILMNPAPASAKGVTEFRRVYLERLGGDMDRQRKIVASQGYQAGDPASVTARYRIHFRSALKRPEHYESLMTRMEAAFHSQGADGILIARAVEDQLMLDTWQAADYDLLPRLRDLRIPTVVMAGDYDFIPLALAEQIAEAVPDAQLVSFRDCGHFAYLERPAEVRSALDELLQRTASTQRRN